MKLSDFTSEYDPADLPIVSGSPMLNVPLNQQIGAVAPPARVQESLANLLTDAVFSYYFAKRVSPELERMATTHDGPLLSALLEVRTSLVKQAVMGIASTIDVTTGRTRSISDALNALKATLKSRVQHSPNDETQVAIDLIRHIQDTTNPDRATSLKYVRHLRNKWAGHPSLDRTVDSWANADTSISFPLLEDALGRMVNACQDLGTLAPMSQDLQHIEAQGHAGVEQLDGTMRYPVLILWSGIDSLATVMRGSGQGAGDAYLHQLA
jgi:hypothetical protein